MTLLLVSQAPLGKLHGYKQRMGWSLPWVSAANTDFNFDFCASYTAEQVRSWGLDEPGYDGGLDAQRQVPQTAYRCL